MIQSQVNKQATRWDALPALLSTNSLTVGRTTVGRDLNYNRDSGVISNGVRHAEQDERE